MQQQLFPRLAAVLGILIIGSVAPAQDAERAFGRIEPGGEPVQIGEPVGAAGWEATGPVSPTLLEMADTSVAEPSPRIAERADTTPPADDPVLQMLQEDLRAAEARAAQSEVDANALPLPGATRPAPESESRPLGGAPTRADADAASTEQRAPSGLGDLARTGAALGAVLTLVFGLAWGVKKLGVGGDGGGRVLQRAAKSPSGLLEVLGRYPVAGRNTLTVLRFDQRVLLVSQRSGGDMTTLCEISDPEEVAGVLLRVRDAAGDSAAAAFEEAISQAESPYTDEAWEPDPAEQREAMDVIPRGRVFTTDEGDRAELIFASRPEGGRERSLASALRGRRA